MPKINIKLNCDLGESFAVWQKGHDNLVMPHIDMANIACGFHAGDAHIMLQTVRLAKQHKVIIGAHPSYQDLSGFGRRSIAYTHDELKALIHYQVGALNGICQSQQVSISYVKPHGALYNDMMANLTIFTTVCSAISELPQPLSLMIQSMPNSQPYQAIANQYKVTLLYEVFADRNYQNNGLLVPRSEPNAVIENVDEILQRCQQLTKNGQILSEHGKPLALPVDSLCVHGDNQHAVKIVEAIRHLYP